MGSLEDDRTRTYNVLLVEDDDICSLAVATLLRKIGHYNVTRASNGAEAIRMLGKAQQSKENKFDLILTDIVMPEVTGFDLMTECSNHGHHLPIVVMSSHDSRDSVLHAFECGAADYLIKPIRWNEAATLWQHVWRANRQKATDVQPKAVTDVKEEEGLAVGCITNSPLNSDLSDQSSADNKNACSGVSTSTAEHDQDSGNRKKHPRDTACDAQDPVTKHPYLAPGSSPCPTAVPALHAVHVELPTPATIFKSANSMKIAETGTEQESCLDRIKSQNAEGQGGASLLLNGSYTGGSMDGSSDPSRVSPGSLLKSSPAAQTSLLKSSPAAQTSHLFRPHALCSGASDAGGSTSSLPTVLQELAEIGKARQQHSPTGQEVVRPVAPQVDTHTTLNHSDRSAFTALTVFLPHRLQEDQASEAPGAMSWLPSLPGILLPLQKHHKRSEFVPVSIEPHPAPNQHTLKSELAAMAGAPQPAELPADVDKSGSVMPTQHSIMLPDSVARFIRTLSAGGAGSEEAPWPNITGHKSKGSSSSLPPMGIQSLVFNNMPEAAGQPSRHGTGAMFGKHSYRAEAVAKYMEKRKHRVFSKKVRYESRKRLAETRPRVRGQFVKHVSAATADDVGRAAQAGGGAAETSGGDASGNSGQEEHADEGEQHAAAALAALGNGNSGRGSNRLSKAPSENENSDDVKKVGGK